MGKKRIISVTLYIAILFSFFSMPLPATIAEDELTGLEALEALVQQWEDLPGDNYTQESYAAFKTALAEANAVVTAGIADSTADSVPIVGAYNDPNWEVLNQDGTFVPQLDQKDVFDAEYIDFTGSVEEPFRATYLPAAWGQYGNPKGLGFIYFRYNRANNPLEIDFTKDKIDITIKSGNTFNGEFNIPRHYVINMTIKDSNSDFSVTRLINGGLWLTLPTNGVEFTASFELADFLAADHSQAFVKNILVPGDYKIEIEEICIIQDIAIDTEAAFAINEFSLTKRVTDVADATEKLQDAIDGLDVNVEIALQDGAKIRTSGEQGLMFGTTIDTQVKQYYMNLGFTPVSYGTVLLPSDLIQGEIRLTKETQNAVYKEFSVSEYPRFTEFNVYLIGWTEHSQRARDITARSYVVYEKEGEHSITVYGSKTVTRSVYTVAINIYNTEHHDARLENNLENGRAAYNWLIGQI